MSKDLNPKKFPVEEDKSEDDYSSNDENNDYFKYEVAEEKTIKKPKVQPKLTELFELKTNVFK